MSESASLLPAVVDVGVEPDEPVVEILGQPVPMPKIKPKAIVRKIRNPGAASPVVTAAKIRSGRKLPEGFASVAHTDGPYDYVLQDGRFYTIDGTKGRVYHGYGEDEALEKKIVERLNNLQQLEEETAQIHDAIVGNRRRAARR